MSDTPVPSKEEVIRWLHRINITGGLGMDAHAALDNALLYLRSAPEPPQASKDAFEAWLNTPGPATSPDNPYTVTLIRHLYEAWCAAWRARAAHEPPAVPAITDLDQYRCQPEKQTYCPHMDQAHALLAAWLKAWDAGSNEVNLYERTRALLKGRAAQPPVPAHRLGWWVVFDEPDDDGKIPSGFFVDEHRAVNFHMELGWKRNHLEAVGLLATAQPHTANDQLLKSILHCMKTDQDSKIRTDWRSLIELTEKRLGLTKGVSP